MTATGQRIAYVRVSTTDQNPARQMEAVGDVDRTFIDRVSGGSRAGREQLATAMDYARAGDVLVVASIDRLARSVLDLQQIVAELLDRDVAVEFVKEGLRFTPEGGDPRDRLMLNMLASLAEFERALIRERQAEGIAIAKAAGRYRGRARVMDDAMVAEARRRIASGETKAGVARALGVGRATLYRYLAADVDDAA